MADQPLHLRSDADLEAALRTLVEAIDWPAAGPAATAGPDMATVVRNRIEGGDGAATRVTGLPWSWRPVRRFAVAAVVVLLALAVLAALAGAAGLGLPGLRILLGGSPVSPPPTTAPSASAATVPGATLGLGDRVDLADLDARAGFDVRWPDDPAIGPPDAAWIDAVHGNQVTLVWAPRPGLQGTFQSDVGLLMTAFRGIVDGGFFSKVVTQGTTVRPVVVDGERAYWLSGTPHFFFYESPTGQVHDPRRWVGDALLWSDGPVTYRLETGVGPDRAVEIAEIGTLRAAIAGTELSRSSQPVLRNERKPDARRDRRGPRPTESPACPDPASSPSSPWSSSPSPSGASSSTTRSCAVIPPPP